MLMVGELSANQPIVSHQMAPKQMSSAFQASAVRSYTATLQDEYNKAMYQAALFESQEQPQQSLPPVFSTPQYQHNQGFSSGQYVQQPATHYQEQTVQNLLVGQPMQQSSAQYQGTSQVVEAPKQYQTPPNASAGQPIPQEQPRTIGAPTF